MNKSKKMKKASRKARIQNIKQSCKKVILWPWRAIKWLWRLLCRVCRAIWNWLKSIDIVGMVNLTLLVAIIILFVSLISNVVCCNKCPKSVSGNTATVQTVSKNAPVKNQDNRRVVQRKFNTALPIKNDVQNGIKPKIKTVGVEKPVVIKELSVPANELPQQRLYGDVIVDVYPASPVLSNGVKIDGNLFVQNVRKYTIPCDAKINGNLFIRNVGKLNFCGGFTVRGNIYVNRESSFGPIPRNAKIKGQIIL